jgi:hypothetical protein
MRKEPRVRLLAGDSGRTFAYAGLVVIRESKTYFERVISHPPTRDSRDFEVVNAFEHELIHFIQSISTAYLYNYSSAMVRHAFSILRHYEQLPSIREERTLFEATARALSSRKDRTFSVRDLLEGVAVVESFKITDPSPTVERFIGFRNEYFPGNYNSSYRRTFDYLGETIGATAAYSLLAPLSFIALQSGNPPDAFITIVDNVLSSDLSVEQLERADMVELFALLEMDIRDHLLYRLDSVPSSHRNPITHECAKYSADLIGVSRLLEIAGRPSRIEDAGLTLDEVHSLFPPIIAYSSTPGTKLEGTTFGVARKDAGLGAFIMYTVGLIGAVERMTLYRDSSALHQFCPHSTGCPYYTTGLCFNYFAPPSIGLGYRDCGFVRVFENQTGAKPDEVWSKLKASSRRS